jgi:hypothetical protein
MIKKINCPKCDYEQEPKNFCPSCGYDLSTMVKETSVKKRKKQKKMFIMRSDNLPENYHTYFDISELQEYEIETLEKIGAEVVFYWYGQGSYEGAGHMIARDKNGWHVFDLSHCSCYGPVENISFGGEPTSKTLKGIEEKCSDDLYKDIKELVRLAKENGYR